MASIFYMVILYESYRHFKIGTFSKLKIKWVNIFNLIQTKLKYRFTVAE